MSGKKIIVVASYPDSVLNFRFHLLMNFLELGFDVTVAGPKDDFVANKLKQFGIKYIDIKLKRKRFSLFKDVRLTLDLIKIFKQEKADMVLNFRIKPSIFATIAAKFSKVKEIYSIPTNACYLFDDDTFKSRVSGVVGRLLFKLSLKYNTKIFFQNKENYNVFLKYNLITKDQPVKICNGTGVDLNYFIESPMPKVTSFIMMSRLTKNKGIKEYIDAARIIRQQYPYVEFKLVGFVDKNKNSASQEKIDKANIDGVITFIDRYYDVRKAIESSSVCVLPSYGEGTHEAVLESMAMGRAIIATDAPGCNETVIPNKNGFLIEPKNAEALAIAMEYFITNPDQVSSMGKASRALCAAKYDVRKTNNAILEGMDIDISKITKINFESFSKVKSSAY